MWWIFFIVIQTVFIVSGIRNTQRAGRWSWSKFAFALAFAGLEVLLVSLPLIFFDLNSRWFWPAYAAAWFVAALNFVWFIIVARRWKLPADRAGLQPPRSGHPKD